MIGDFNKGILQRESSKRVYTIGIVKCYKVVSVPGSVYPRFTKLLKDTIVNIFTLTTTCKFLNFIPFHLPREFRSKVLMPKREHLLKIYGENLTHITLLIVKVDIGLDNGSSTDKTTNFRQVLL